MKMHLFLYAAITLAATLVSAEAGLRPNVVFIYADDMGFGEIQALNPERGLIPTPHLNRLAGEGMVFTDAHTSSSVCTPSRYSLLTGRYNWRTRLQRGVIGDGGEPLISADRLTLATLFRNQGYSTAIVGKWHLDYHYNLPAGAKKRSGKEKMTEPHFYAPAPIGSTIPDGPVTRGFDTFYGFQQSASMSSIVRNDTIFKEIPFVETLPDMTRAIVDMIEEKAKAAKAGQPFFIYYAMNSPHSPVAPAPEWKGKGTLGTYSDFVAQTDGSVGEVLDALDAHGLTENTIVIFSSDNGTSQGKGVNIPEMERAGHFPSAVFRGYKADLWDGGHRVPFILRWPAQVEAKSQSDQLVCMTDMMATFAELFGEGLPEDAGEDSISFYPVLSGKTFETWREAIVHHSAKGRFSIRQGNWKLLLAPGSGGRTAPYGSETQAMGLPDMQLYDLDTDPGERVNLIAEHPERVEALIALLEDYVRRGRSIPGESQTNDAKIDIYKTNMNSDDPHPNYR